MSIKTEPKAILREEGKADRHLLSRFPYTSQVLVDRGPGSLAQGQCTAMLGEWCQSREKAGDVMGVEGQGERDAVSVVEMQKQAASMRK